MGLSSLSYSTQGNGSWTAQKNVTGASPNTNQSSITNAKATLGTQAANNAAGGADELYFSIASIAASGTLSLNLQSLTDILGAALNFARVKAIKLQLLSTAQDSVNGTNCSSVSLDTATTNSLTSQSKSGWLNNATSGIDLPNGCYLEFACPNANGITVDATHNILHFTNNDAGNAAAMQITVVGGSS